MTRTTTSGAEQFFAEYCDVMINFTFNPLDMSHIPHIPYPVGHLYNILLWLSYELRLSNGQKSVLCSHCDI